MVLPVSETNGDVSVDGEDSRDDDGEEEGWEKGLRTEGEQKVRLVDASSRFRTRRETRTWRLTMYSFPNPS